MASEHVEIPGWLREALEGELTDKAPSKRAEPRRVWWGLASVQRHDGVSEKQFSVKMTNVSPEGIGFISRQPLEVGDRLQLIPDGDSNGSAPLEPVNVRIIHCTQTVQGYKVGCLFEQKAR